MSNTYLLIVILCMSLVTFSLRVVPFMFMNFFKHRPIIIYLGRALPGIVMVILVVFSVKDAPYLHGIVKSEVRQSHSIFLRMFFENIQPVTRHYGAPWGAY
ncbi:MAG: hypothetical protein GY821_15445 [Gammaproteobacteria bacterium]|nr:hypothetical protein [Gammaproteobacteria bacterium]